MLNPGCTPTERLGETLKLVSRVLMQVLTIATVQNVILTTTERLWQWWNPATWPRTHDLNRSLGQFLGSTSKRAPAPGPPLSRLRQVCRNRSHLAEAQDTVQIIFMALLHMTGSP